jgi:periplasmic divalent cation tolerance protein
VAAADGVVQAETTAPSLEEAQRLAAELVGRRLAACAHVAGPIRSTYWWEGEVQREEEYALRLKTRASLVGELERALAELHPYDVPELLVFEAAAGGRSYLDWVLAETRAP